MVSEAFRCPYGPFRVKEMPRTSIAEDLVTLGSSPHRRTSLAWREGHEQLDQRGTCSRNQVVWVCST